jgi:hypothetical protein
MNPLFLSAAAQAEATSESLSDLAKYGPLGIFCVLLIGALVWTVKAWRSSMEARTADAKEYAVGLKEVGDAGAALAVEANKVQEAAKTSLEKLTMSCVDLKTNNTQEHSELKGTIDKLREKQVEFVAAANAKAQIKGNG